MSASEIPETPHHSVLKWGRLARDTCFWFLVAALAWAPFPLGSNREWSWGLLSILVALCWLLWAVWALTTLEVQRENLRRVWVPLSCAMFVLIWAIVQVLPIAPAGWAHPLWASTGGILGRPIAGAISLNPWRSANEIVKLLTYIAAAWMVFTLARDEVRATRLLNAWIIIGSLYAIYAFVIGLAGTQQFRIFYSMAPALDWLSGPFVQRNNFATYEGLAALAAVARLVELGHDKILASRGARRFALTALQFTFGSGVRLVIATALTVSALIASGSRGGFFSTLLALMVMAFIVATLPQRKKNWKLLIGAAGSALLLIGALTWINGELLNEHLLDLTAPNAEHMRQALWGASTRMIASTPLLGLGLGTFQDAYPMYATQVFPYIMDKAHNDYLEFAAGLGLPAAILWWAMLAWLSGKFWRGVSKRRKNKIYPLLGIGATMLVAAHSLVDFSLQMPAIALTYAACLGLALAQSDSSKSFAK